MHISEVIESLGQHSSLAFACIRQRPKSITYLWHRRRTPRHSTHSAHLWSVVTWWCGTPPPVMPAPKTRSRTCICVVYSCCRRRNTMIFLTKSECICLLWGWSGDERERQPKRDKNKIIGFYRILSILPTHHEPFLAGRQWRRSCQATAATRWTMAMHFQQCLCNGEGGKREKEYYI